MAADKTFYTPTMARVLTNQEKYEEAAQIYRYLLEREPDRRDIQQKLKAVSVLISTAPGQWKDMAGLIEKWVRLVLEQHRLRYLQKICLQKEKK